MTSEITYTQARANLSSLLDRVTSDREIIMIRRRNGEDAALIAAEELSSLLETAYLLRSPQNARRLLDALSRALRHGGQPLDLQGLRREVDWDAEAT